VPFQVTGWKQMSGKIFINYRRDDSSASAGRLYDHLSARFPRNQIFIDVDTKRKWDGVDVFRRSLGEGGSRPIFSWCRRGAYSVTPVVMLYPG
jgi:hypothetical protein